MGIKENAFAYIDAHRSEMLKMWEELVSIDSGSDYKPGVDKVVAKVAGILTDMGGKTRIVEHANAGNAVVSEFGDCANKPFIVLTGILFSATLRKPKPAPLRLRTAVLTDRARWI